MHVLNIFIHRKARIFISTNNKIARTYNLIGVIRGAVEPGKFTTDNCTFSKVFEKTWNEKYKVLVYLNHCYIMIKPMGLKVCLKGPPEK